MGRNNSDQIEMIALSDCFSPLEHHQHSNEVLIDMDNEKWEPALECSIYRVPKRLREKNVKAYTPLIVSIGPLHHGKSELASMEKQKKRCKKFLHEKIGLEEWNSLEMYMKDNKKVISNFYEDTIELKTHEFEDMVLLDAVFIIVYLWKNFYNENDFLVRRPDMRLDITRDLLLLENQLPYSLLVALYTKAFNLGDGLSSGSPPFLTLCTHFFPPHFSFVNFRNLNEQLDIKHFTDLFRYAILKPQLTERSTGVLANLPSATKLNESGLKFIPIGREPSSIFDVKFKKRRRLIPLFEVSELHMPRLFVGDNTECFLRNLMAFELCHCPWNNHVSNYIDLLDNLIDTKEDVELLVKKGILINTLGDHNALAEMINKIMQSLIMSPSYLFDVGVELDNHYNSSWNHAQATLVRVYFSNPWSATATIAASILLLLTLIQSICSILSAINL